MRIQHKYLMWDSHTEAIDPIKNILDKYAINYNFEENLDIAISNFKYQLEFYLFEGVVVEPEVCFCGESSSRFYILYTLSIYIFY